MCGLVGLVLPSKKQFSDRHWKSVKTMLLMNQIRGKDSTGMLAVSSDHAVKTIKNTGTPQRLFKDPIWDEYQKSNLNSKTRIVAGHGRSATVGKITTENSHPFTVKRKDESSLIFAHNGTLEIYQTLPDIDKFDVDSEWLASKLAEGDPLEILGEVNGAVACWWYDTKTRKFNLYHDLKRPLYFMHLETGEFFFSSDTVPLDTINSLFDYDAKSKDICELETYNLTAIDLSGEALSFENLKVKRKTAVVSIGSYVGAATPYTEYMGSSYKGWDKYLSSKSSKDTLFAAFGRFMKIKYNGSLMTCKVKLPSSHKILSQTMQFTGTQTFPYMHRYANSMDDSICIGERVPVEIYNIETTSAVTYNQRPLLKIQALGMNGTKLNHVFFEFWSAEFSADELEKIDFLTGTVASIRAITDSDKISYDIDSEILVRLDSIKPANMELVK